MKFSEYIKEKDMKLYLKKVSTESKGKQFELDGELVDIVDFVEVNTADDVEPLTPKEIDNIIKLAAGKEMAIGAGFKLKRVK